MMTADQAREQVRSPLAILLQHHVERGTPRMDAYVRVAGLIGRSPAWVQRVIGRRPDTTVGLHDALNIRAAYERICARIEAAADQKEAANAAWENADALREGRAAADASDRLRVVAPMVREVGE